MDASRIERELGFADVISRAEGLRRAVLWERANRGELSPRLLDYEAEDALIAELG